MIDYRKAMLRGLVATGFLLGVGSAAFARGNCNRPPRAAVRLLPRARVRVPHPAVNQLRVHRLAA